MPDATYNAWNPAHRDLNSQGYDLRATLHSAVAFVQSIEANRALAPFTLSHAVKEQVQFLGASPAVATRFGLVKRNIVDAKGASVGSRASRWERLDALLRDTENLVAKVREAGDSADKLVKLGIYEAGEP